MEKTNAEDRQKTDRMEETKKKRKGDDNPQISKSGEKEMMQAESATGLYSNSVVNHIIIYQTLSIIRTLYPHFILRGSSASALLCHFVRTFQP